MQFQLEGRELKSQKTFYPCPSLLRFLSAAAGSTEKPFLGWRQVSRLSEGFLGPGARAKPVTEKGISESALGLNGLPKSKRTRKVRPD